MAVQGVKAAQIVFSQHQTWSTTQVFSPRRSWKPAKFTVVAQQSSSRGSRKVLHATPPATVQRRSGNYGPDIWESHEYSKPDDNTSRRWGHRVEELKKYVKRELLSKIGCGEDDDDDDDDDEEMVAERIEIIDTLQRLGVGYHFEREIQSALGRIAANPPIANNLHIAALRFRLLRRTGIRESPEEDGKFKQEISGDVRGLLSLYEASYLGFPGEIVLDEAKSFARTHLQEIYRKAETDMANPTTMQLQEAKQLARALELPSHWRTRRCEAWWHIEQYREDSTEGMDPAGLELAMLEFNMVQLVYQAELEELHRWWKKLGLPKKLGFARDRLTESFQWAVGLIQEPQFSYCRKTMTKLTCLINVVDDVYDVYGSLDELHLFTTAIQRWDAGELDLLPEYMQVCFMAIHDTTNELAHHTMEQQGFNSLPYIKQAWQEQCRRYLEEAKTFHNNGGLDIQTFEEYLEHGRKSIASRIVLIHTYGASGETLTKEAFDYITNDPRLTFWIATVARLTNDLATSKA
ncbi:unnamed protein product [Linum tenue]|uniref:Uncharacterized protein n=1 Tax=Linum tenue TaxID=586396 RepID=A0AAV0KHY6_9ROSI|nr:unnamed protein product [Linum tenue]